jgi:hypothetical protein
MTLPCRWPTGGRAKVTSSNLSGANQVNDLTEIVRKRVKTRLTTNSAVLGCDRRWLRHRRATDWRPDLWSLSYTYENRWGSTSNSNADEHIVSDPSLRSGRSPLASGYQGSWKLYHSRLISENRGEVIHNPLRETSMPFSTPASWPTAFWAFAPPSASMRSWSRFSYPAPFLSDSYYLLDHGN